MNIFVFDIETIPDIESGRKILGFHSLNDAEVLDAMQAKARESGSEFMRHHLHKIIAISGVLRTQDDTLKVRSLGNINSTESELIHDFFTIIDKRTPMLVSWNGGGFDLPVLHYRAMLHGVQAPGYWETGDGRTDFRYNNYLSRYHWRHLDLMDVLSGFQPRAVAKLDEIAVMLGFPGKLGMSGADVLPAFQRGELENIRHYCETDVLNTYLVYLRFALMRGQLSVQDYQAECDKLKAYLETSAESHLQEFLQAWTVCRP